MTRASRLRASRYGAQAALLAVIAAPTSAAGRVNAVVLPGGSAYGLDAANGTMRWLDERTSGWLSRLSRQSGGAAAADGMNVPTVSSAVLIDLWVGDKPSIRPGADCG